MKQTLPIQVGLVAVVITATDTKLYNLSRVFTMNSTFRTGSCFVTNRWVTNRWVPVEVLNIVQTF